MKLSGFTMVKNADKLFYPIKPAIMSVLPIVDEFVVALGNCDPDDKTRAEIESIQSDKIRIIDTIWDIKKYPRGMENAHQTDIAKSACSGDWVIYLQADEVIHENDLPTIEAGCKKYLDDKEVEGFILKYRHFWGDFDHYHTSHGWYKHEVRIVRNDPEIHSWESAQSFRRIPDFDGLNYRQQKNTYRLNVVSLDAWIYHYGWVRPPRLMKKKTKALTTIHKGTEQVKQMEQQNYFEFDYGPLNWLGKFEGTHPAVMKDWIKKFDWKEELQYSGRPKKGRKLNKHEKLKYRIFSYIKNNILCGSEIGEFKNYYLMKK